jgi:hypothetical protein
VVAFIASWIILVILVVVVFRTAKRRPAGSPLTWGEALLGATFAFFAMFWAYGVIPSLWLTWADSELKWRPDNLVYGPLDLLQPVPKGGAWFPITVSYQTVRDIIAVGIYVGLLGSQMWLWAWWQQRGQRVSTEVLTSDYGRPLVKKA